MARVARHGSGAHGGKLSRDTSSTIRKSSQGDDRMMALQKPRFVYMSGRLRPWDEATLHVGCEAATRGLNVFEGIKGYWSPDGQFGIVMLPPHHARLGRSAR